MGGAVKTVSEVFRGSIAPIYEVPKAVVNGGSLHDIVQAAGGKQLKNDFGIVKTAIMGQQPDQPNPTYNAPNQAAIDAQQQQAARDAQVNLRNDRPGRNQTILSDNSAYPYRLV